MQNSYNYHVDFAKLQREHERKKKEDILNNVFFKMLENNNKKEYDKIMEYVKDKTADEIEIILKFIINKKSVQKISF